ncbi:MAG: sigma-54 dependent transcriptional regulator [Alphaproteobacteria bacterium]|nr:sigma-54 dependent transcriptional regulator [Alphaproteobacteria bacterium]
MRLLIVGSLDGQIGTAAKVALARGGQVLQADSIAGALDVLRQGNGADLAMVDVKLDIAKFIGALADERINMPVVACGTSADTKAAVAAIKAGAKEYIPLPPDTELIGAVLTAVSQEQNQYIAVDPVMTKIMEKAAQIAPSEAGVLITGESGTGKEVMARYIHNKSRRVSAKFVALNCAAIPENLLESEMFGYEKGAFTGAVARRIGKFEEAGGGTLLLDEISEMDLKLQAKLLRAIQEREIDRIGGKSPIKVDVRILATSNRDLLEEVKNGRFRQDLYYRLNVVNIALPGLREHRGDIVPLSDFFIKKYSELNRVPVRALSKDACDKMLAYDWPGNVRELENTMHRAVLLATGSSITADAFEFAEQKVAMVPSKVGQTMAVMERDLIIDTLRHTLGNRTHAATILGISLRSLRNKLKQYSDQGIDVPPSEVR